MAVNEYRSYSFIRFSQFYVRFCSNCYWFFTGRYCVLSSACWILCTYVRYLHGTCINVLCLHGRYCYDISCLHKVSLTRIDSIRFFPWRYLYQQANYSDFDILLTYFLFHRKKYVLYTIHILTNVYTLCFRGYLNNNFEIIFFF